MDPAFNMRQRALSGSVSASAHPEPFATCTSALSKHPLPRRVYVNPGKIAVPTKPVSETAGACHAEAPRTRKKEAGKPGRPRGHGNQEPAYCFTGTGTFGPGTACFSFVVVFFGGAFTN